MPLNIDWQQILLHWMNLAILTGGLYFLLYKPVKQFMEKREAHYREHPPVSHPPIPVRPGETPAAPGGGRGPF